MTHVLNGKGLLLEGSNPKIEDKQVPGIYTYIYLCRLFRQAEATKAKHLDSAIALAFEVFKLDLGWTV